MSEPAAPRFDATEVRRYYDRHTGAFLAFGQGRRSGVIHRAVWGPGVRRRDEAFRYVEDHIATLVQGLPDAPVPRHILDLGCGAGASACHLAARLPVRVTGVTLSPIQARLAAARARATGVDDRVTCLEADFTNLPPDVGPADLAYAIESFVHAPDPARFFAECRRVVRPGGLLVICDDFARRAEGAAAAAAVERFRRGWHVNTLLRPDEVRALAAAAGFSHEETLDLTPYLELGRVRDHAIAALAPVVDRLPWMRQRVDHLVGGSALQACLSRGWVGYDLVRFRA